MPTPDLVCPIFEGNLDYFRYFTTQCALFRTKKELSILSGNGGTQFAKDRLLLWATIFSVRRSLRDQKRFYGWKKSLLKAWDGNIQNHSIEGEKAVTFTITKLLALLRILTNN